MLAASVASAVGVEPLPRLVRVRADPRDRDLDGARLRAGALRDERGEAAAEALGVAPVGRS